MSGQSSLLHTTTSPEVMRNTRDAGVIASVQAGVARLVLFKIRASAALVEELRGAIDERYRAAGRLSVINFESDIVARTRDRRIPRVPESWYTRAAV